MAHSFAIPTIFASFSANFQNFWLISMPGVAIPANITKWTDAGRAPLATNSGRDVGPHRAKMSANAGKS
ncbi:MAG: hypothetical protein ACOYLS_06315 [Polymorphobacter sp.]